MDDLGELDKIGLEGGAVLYVLDFFEIGGLTRCGFLVAATGHLDILLHRVLCVTF